MTSDVSNPPARRADEFWEKHGINAAFVCQAILLLIAGWQNRHLLNTDGVAYLRIASYYANGQTDLMVSGYWGPLLSWLMVPWLKLGFEPLAAARVAMGLSALVFTLGCNTLFRRLELSVPKRVVGVWLAAGASVFWSVRYITPDVLLSGLMALAVSGVIDRRWNNDCELAMQTGLLWALAFLAKAVAFPLAFVVTLGLAVVWKMSGAKKGILRSLAWTFVPFILAALPWIIALSLKYHTATFSTSGRINHAIVGPPDRERYHPFSRTFHRPEPGRVTSWEDPSVMPYNYWSPFANPRYALYQVKVIIGNAVSIFKLLGGVNFFEFGRLRGGLNPQDAVKLLPGFDLCFFGLLGLAGCLAGWNRKTLAEERWRWIVVPAGLLAGVYLPVYLLPDDQRYFYPLFPLMWAGASGLLDWVLGQADMRGTRIELIGARVLTASFALPALFWLLVALVGIPNPASDCAQDLAARMQQAKLSGPIAGSGQLPGGRAGLFLAYFMEQPWYGDRPQATAALYRSANARFVVVYRGEAVVDQLDHDPVFKNLDALLFKLPGEAEKFPLKVYEVKTPAGQ